MNRPCLSVYPSGTIIVEQHIRPHSKLYTLREESSQTNVILQYKLLAAILSAVCSVIIILLVII